MRCVVALLAALSAAASAIAADTFPATGGNLLITPIIHASVQIEHAGTVIQVAPWSAVDLSPTRRPTSSSSPTIPGTTLRAGQWYP